MKRAFSPKNLWETLPRPIKSTAGRLLGLMPPEWPLGRSFRRHLALVEKAQACSIDEIQAFQLEQVRGICQLAYERTAFYRRSFDAAGFDPKACRSLEDLQRLPTIDRHTLIEHLPELCTQSPETRGIDMVSTGGTGGNPLKFYIGSGRSGPEYAHLVSSWRRVGYDLRMPQAVIRGAIVPPDATGLRHDYDPLLRRHYYSNFHMSDDNMWRYLEHIATIGTCYLHVYPSSVATLARFMHRKSIAPPANIRGILAGSENVYPEDRELVERVFKLRMFSWYGHSEKLIFGSECEHSYDYHIFPTYGYFELLDETGRPVTVPGQRGEIVGTGFINRIVPFIRYRTGDEATYVADGCPKCGRQQIVLRDIRGHRTQEMLVASDGSMISWTAMNMHDDTFNGVRQFQFVQEEPGLALLRIVPGEGFGEDDRRRIERKLNAKLDGRVRFQIEQVEQIALTKSGKSTYVDQRIDPERLRAEKPQLMSATGVHV